jgi:hypothetical protein
MIAFLLTSLLLADPCVSGVPVGSRPGPYSFLLATGPDRGKQECYICGQDNKPTVVVFTRATTPAVSKLMAALDAEMLARKETGFKAWMTLLTDKADLDTLAKWAVSTGLKSVTVGIYEDADGPPSYKIARDAEVTVMVFQKKKVLANMALRARELDDKRIQAVITALGKFERE